VDIPHGHIKAYFLTG